MSARRRWLSSIGEEHTLLMGEVMGMRDEASAPVSYLVGYFERDYGRSALYARKKVVIDASDLASGITLSWAGGEQNPARVLALGSGFLSLALLGYGATMLARSRPRTERR
jgi:hypothetical protein